MSRYTASPRRPLLIARRHASSSRRANITAYISTLLLLSTSGATGLPSLLGSREASLLAALTVLLGLALSKGRLPSFWVSTLPIVLFLFILFAQSVQFSYFPFVTIAGFLTRLLIALLACLIAGRILFYFSRILVFLSPLTVTIWLVTLIPHMAEALYHVSLPYPSQFAVQPRSSVLLYTFIEDFSSSTLQTRNAGPFLEPALFGIYLVLALAVLWNLYPFPSRRTQTRNSALLIVAILTTASTTAYISLLVLVLIQLSTYSAYSLSAKIRDNPRVVYSIIFLSILLAFSLIAWQSLPFLGEKFSTQMHQALYYDGPNPQLGRLGNIRFNLDYIRDKPILGWGLSLSTRFALHDGGRDIAVRLGSGISNFAASFGLLGLFAYLGFFYFGLRNRALASRSTSLKLLAVLITLGFGHNLYFFPFGLSLMFTPLTASIPSRRPPIRYSRFNRLPLTGPSLPPLNSPLSLLLSPNRPFPNPLTSQRVLHKQSLLSSAEALRHHVLSTNPHFHLASHADPIPTPSRPRLSFSVCGF